MKPRRNTVLLALLLTVLGILIAAHRRAADERSLDSKADGIGGRKWREDRGYQREDTLSEDEAYKAIYGDSNP